MVQTENGPIYINRYFSSVCRGEKLPGFMLRSVFLTE